MPRRRKRWVIWITYQSTIKLVSSAALIMLLVFLFTYELPATKTWTYWTLPLSGKTIALDAGHGGADGGAKSKEGTFEENITLAITKYVRDYLQQAGAVVVMTREEDKDLADENTKGYSARKTQDLVRRARFITDNKSDLFLSVHLNAIPSPRWSGAQTFYYRNHKDNPILAALIQDELKKKSPEHGQGGQRSR